MLRNLAQIILYDNDQRVFLQVRDEKAPTNPNTLGLFGGAIEDGENAETAVKRECKEELNYNLSSPRLWDKSEYTIGENDGTRFVYIEKYDEKILLDCREGNGEWLKCDKALKDSRLQDIDRPILQRLKDELLS